MNTPDFKVIADQLEHVTEALQSAIIAKKATTTLGMTALASVLLLALEKLKYPDPALGKELEAFIGRAVVAMIADLQERRAKVN